MGMGVKMPTDNDRLTALETTVRKLETTVLAYNSAHRNSAHRNSAHRNLEHKVDNTMQKLRKLESTQVIDRALLILLRDRANVMADDTMDIERYKPFADIRSIVIAVVVAALTVWVFKT